MGGYAEVPFVQEVPRMGTEDTQGAVHGDRTGV